MKPSRKYLRNRQVECLARDLLREKGYEVVRSAGVYAPVDLVAWKRDNSILFLRTGRIRTASLESIVALASKFRHEIESLRRLPRLPSMTVQLWVYFDRHGWRFFDVHPGGIVEVEG